MRFEVFMALRYLRTKRKGIFTLVTTGIGIAGVTIGVAALLTTLSVMNGFQADIRKKIVGAQAHVTVHARMDEARKKRLEAVLEARPEVEAFSPFVVGQAIVTYEGRSTGVVVKGIDPDPEFRVNSLGSSLTAGSWNALRLLEEGATPGKDGAGNGKKDEPPGIVLGEELAKGLGVWLDDVVVIVSPPSASEMGFLPPMKRFKVVGLLHTGYYEYDSAAGYVSLPAAAAFFETPGGLSGMQVKLKDLDDADRVSDALRGELGWEFSVSSFTEMNRTLFAALKLEKFVMFLILALIILVASLNIASNLILMGTEKTRDIGLLKAMGASPRQIRRIFLWVGALIGGIGVGLGTLLGLLLSWVIWRFPIVELPADIYYLSRVPVQVELPDVLGVTLCGLILSMLAAVYPAFRASRADPIEAIHYYG